MRRWLLIGLGLVLAIAVAGLGMTWGMGALPFEVLGRLVMGVQPPVVVGLLHSRSGPMAASEKSLVDAELMAIEEINARGGIGGRRIEAQIADGQSNVSAFVSEARRLIDSVKVSVLFGCSTSEVRKAVLEVVEGRHGLLLVPGNFEGIERSPRVIYCGGTSNQSVIPSVRWAIDALKVRRFFVVGSQEIWSRSASEIAKDAIKAQRGELVGEYYLPVEATDMEPVVAAIKASRPEVILSAILGETNPAFYAALGREGLTPEKLPVISYTVSEDELRQIPPGSVAGHYSAWNYFQSVDRPENRAFVERFKARFGRDRVTSDAVVSAYNAVLIWAQSAKESGTSDPDQVVDHLSRQSLDAPDAVITLDSESRGFWRQFHVGRVRLDGQFDIVWSIIKPIRPLTYVGTRSREQWHTMLEGFRAGWSGRWSSSAPRSLVPSPVPSTTPSPLAPGSTP